MSTDLDPFWHQAVLTEEGVLRAELSKWGWPEPQFGARALVCVALLPTPHLVISMRASGSLLAFVVLAHDQQVVKHVRNWRDGQKLRFVATRGGSEKLLEVQVDCFLHGLDGGQASNEPLPIGMSLYDVRETLQRLLRAQDVLPAAVVLGA